MGRQRGVPLLGAKARGNGGVAAGASPVQLLERVYERAVYHVVGV